MRQVLIAGCGFLGGAAAFILREEGFRVLGVTAGEERASALRSEGVPCLASDLSDAGAMGALREKIGAQDFWVHCASSGKGGPEEYAKVYLEGARNLSHFFPEAFGVFISSTSVYAQEDGSWADEGSEAFPKRETGRILLETEKEVCGGGGVSVRLAGLYGPGRSVLLRKFLAGEACLEEGGRRWINQIHQRDAAAALPFLFLAGKGGEIYNLADDLPLQQIELYRGMAERLGRGLPPEGRADFGRKRGWTNKRVSNQKIRALGWFPKYPSYFDSWEELLVSSQVGC